MTLEVQKMKVLGIGAAIVAVFGVTGCAYHTPVEPSATTTVDVSAPSQLTLGVLPGTGTATVTARVQNANGAGVANVIVTFTSSAGTIDPARVATGADGRATATLTGAGTSQVSASAGKLSAQSLVSIQAPVAATPTPTPTTPVPGPTPSPTPLPSAFLNVSSSATTGVPLTFGVSSSATGVTWTWDFGDGTNAQTTAFSTSHAYAKAGVYTATVSSPGVSSANATIVVSDPPAPPSGTSPSGSLVAALTCTPGTHGSTTVCNVNLTFSGTAVSATNISGVTWDWGDGAITSVNSPLGSHVYAQAGTYTVITTAIANINGTSQTAPTVSKSIVVP